MHDLIQIISLIKAEKCYEIEMIQFCTFFRSEKTMKYFFIFSICAIASGWTVNALQSLENGKVLSSNMIEQEVKDDIHTNECNENGEYKIQ